MIGHKCGEDCPVYHGKYKCPSCGSRDTGSQGRTIATTDRWMMFECRNCQHTFRKLSAKVSSLSARWAS